MRIILKTLVGLITLCLLSVSGMAQDTPTLIPFTNQAYAIQGLIPDGWTNLGSGIYAQGSSATDVTVLALQSAVVKQEDLLQSLLPQIGLQEMPEPVGTTKTNSFEWTLYQVDAEQGDKTIRIDLAVTEVEGRSYLVLLQTSAEEYEALHSSVFVPILEALAPLELAEENVSYHVEDVTFTNQDVTLSGTLTRPEMAGRHPAVVLMTGSGPQDRNEEVVPGFPIFKLIADHLTRQGIAVLRYDDRGVGKSTGDYSEASIYDFAADAKSAVAYLRSRDDIDPDQVGVLGHSEGGIYAALLGADADSGIAFIISMAGTAVSGEEVLLEQNRLIFESEGASQVLIDSQLDYLKESFPLIAARDWDAVEQLSLESALAQWDLFTEEQRTTYGNDADAFAQQIATSFRKTYAAEWFATMLEYDPGIDWAKTHVPVLGIFGGKDVQVADEQNADPLKEALAKAGNEDVTIVVIPDANHLFQGAITGATSEYLQLPLEFTPDFLTTISDWLLEHITLAQ